MAYMNSLVPARFLSLIAHLVILITILWARDANVKACLPLEYTDEQYSAKDTELIIGLSLGIAFIGIELICFMSGTTMFMHSQSLISIGAHASGAVALSFYLFEEWPCDTFWWIFGFCSAFPFFTEILTVIGVVGLGRH
ncbi:transmembrane protein 107-like [Saccoglossus kowalevskii]|uniref:Transmembrane protein 107 n=1 Tax=Saccoglossus kowalevskii TaxID=10224 RepID=A0ABM0GXB3_SACKO|nr:PREDICTED: transmembrane protein 107-like [Saccoglossus kowalevskii]